MKRPLTRVYNRTEEKPKRQELRQTMPRAEVVLWSRLRGRQVADAKFRRQHSVGPYLIDFYCAELKLAIEVDGDSHFGDGAELRDARRQAYLEGFGIRFLRFLNGDVLKHFDCVVDAIGKAVVEMRAQHRGSGAAGGGASGRPGTPAQSSTPPPAPPC